MKPEAPPALHAPPARLGSPPPLKGRSCGANLSDASPFTGGARVLEGGGPLEARRAAQGIRSGLVAAAACVLCLAGVLGIVLSKPAGRPIVLGAYSAGLADRTPHQRYNARLAASRIDGTVIQPGAIFSYNQALGGWSAARGYLKAPVSYDGVLIDNYGGGVCETSTVIYNAALLAGLDIIERHQHTFAPSYVPPGRDAAVAYANIDLRLRNSYPVPIRLNVDSEYGKLVCRITGAVKHPPTILLTSQVIDTLAAPVVSAGRHPGSVTARWHLHGRAGVRVDVYREVYGSNGQLIERRMIADNTYQPMAAVR